MRLLVHLQNLAGLGYCCLKVSHPCQELAIWSCSCFSEYDWSESTQPVHSLRDSQSHQTWRNVGEIMIISEMPQMHSTSKWSVGCTRPLCWSMLIASNVFLESSRKAKTLAMIIQLIQFKPKVINFCTILIKQHPKVSSRLSISMIALYVW